MEEGVFHCCVCGKNSEIRDGRLVKIVMRTASGLPISQGNRGSSKGSVLCKCGWSGDEKGKKIHLGKNTTCEVALAYQEAHR